ncbi:uncharacterized protein [Centruroides vittatus]|uniref:uncharacterized protein isoform X2 n=1 Tax=Centruroides vittatus TaxID=120091 RepID=UPI00350EB469
MNSSNMKQPEDKKYFFNADKTSKYVQPCLFNALEIHAKFQHYRSENYAQAVRNTSCISVESKLYKKNFSPLKYESIEENCSPEIILSKSVPSSPKQIHVSKKSLTLPSSRICNFHYNETCSSSISNFFKKFSPKIRKSLQSKHKPWIVIQFSQKDLDTNNIDSVKNVNNSQTFKFSSSKKDFCDKFKTSDKSLYKRKININNIRRNGSLTNLIHSTNKIHNKYISLQSIKWKKRKYSEKEINCWKNKFLTNEKSFSSRLYGNKSLTEITSLKSLEDNFSVNHKNKKGIFTKKFAKHEQAHHCEDYSEVPSIKVHTSDDLNQKDPVNEVTVYPQPLKLTLKSLSMTSLNDKALGGKHYTASKLTRINHNYSTDSSLLIVPETSVHPRRIQPPQTLSLHSKIFVPTPQTDKMANKMASVESIGSCSLDFDGSESSCASDMKDEVTVSEKTLKSCSVVLSSCDSSHDTELLRENNCSLPTREEKSSSDGSATKLTKRHNADIKEECSVAEIKLPSYVSISCAINGYTSYGRFCRSRDNSPARFPLSSSPLKNWEQSLTCNTNSKSAMSNGEKDPTKEFNRNISYKESKELFIGKQLEIPLLNGGETPVNEHNISDTNGKLDVTDNAVNGLEDEKGILLETLQEFGSTTSKHKSLVLQRIESLYGPSSDEICKVRPRNNKLIEPTDKSMTVTRRSPSCPPQVSRNQSRSPPVFRHLTKDFRDQLKGSDSNSYTVTKNIKLVNGSGKVHIIKSNLADIPSSPLSPKENIENDGNWFITLMEKEKKIIQQQIVNTEKYLEDSSIPEEACGKIRSAIGKANLLLTQKFEQFYQLCLKNINQDIDEPVPTSSDLTGFWDLVLLQVADVKNTFSEIQKLKENNWLEVKSPEGRKIQPKIRRQVPPGTSKSNPSTPSRSSKSAELAKAREQARKQLMEAKRRGRKQNAAQDSETEIAIFIPQNANTH